MSINGTKAFLHILMSDPNILEVENYVARFWETWKRQNPKNATKYPLGARSLRFSATRCSIKCHTHWNLLRRKYVSSKISHLRKGQFWDSMIREKGLKEATDSFMFNCDPYLSASYSTKFQNFSRPLDYEIWIKLSMTKLSDWSVWNVLKCFSNLRF